MLFPLYLVLTKPEKHLSLEIYKENEGRVRPLKEGEQGAALVDFKCSCLHDDLSKTFPTIESIVPERFSFRTFVNAVLTDSFDTNKLRSFHNFATRNVESLMKTRSPRETDGDGPCFGPGSGTKRVDKLVHFKRKFNGAMKNTKELGTVRKLLDLVKNHAGVKPIVKKITIESKELEEFYRKNKAEDVMKQINEVLEISDEMDSAVTPRRVRHEEVDDDEDNDDNDSNDSDEESADDEEVGKRKRKKDRNPFETPQGNTRAAEDSTGRMAYEAEEALCRTFIAKLIKDKPNGKVLNKWIDKYLDENEIATPGTLTVWFGNWRNGYEKKIVNMILKHRKEYGKERDSEFGKNDPDYKRIERQRSLTLKVIHAARNKALRNKKEKAIKWKYSDEKSLADLFTEADAGETQDKDEAGTCKPGGDKDEEQDETDGEPDPKRSRTSDASGKKMQLYEPGSIILSNIILTSV